MRIPFFGLCLALVSGYSDARVPEESKFSFLENQPSFDCSLVPRPEGSDPDGKAFADLSPLKDVYNAARKDGFSGGSVIVLLKFDNHGFVESAGIAKSSRNLSVDIATLNWARCTRIQPGKAREFLLPVHY